MNASFKIFGTNAFRTVLLGALPAFERAHGVKSEVDFGATNHTLARMRAGETADLVFATKGALTELAGEGRIVAGSITVLAEAGVGAAVLAGKPKPDISTVAALKQTLLNAKSIGHSRMGQSGIHIAKVIADLGIADAIKDKITIHPAGLVAELLVAGKVELAFQQLSELMAVKGVDIVGPIPDALQLKTIVAAGVGAGSARGKEAKALLEILASPAQDQAKRDAGLIPAH
jgi:molybdate transport system substrate-binding protein